MHGLYVWQADVGELSGTVFEASGGGGWIIGNETFDKSRTFIGRITGCRLAGRPLWEAEPKGANKKAAMQISSTGLKLATAMAQTYCSSLLGVGQETGRGDNSLENHQGGVGIYASTCFNIFIRRESRT